ncbi:MAG: tRNA pseudouridine(13) synthase TruD, partial [Phycisphaerales bacterium JB064]
RLGRTETNFMVSALQSAIFNAVLRERMKAGTLDTLMEGDVAVLHGARRTTFVVSAEEAGSAELAERVANLEVSPSGPMWGPEMRMAQGVPGEIERAALTQFGVTPEDMERFARKNKGALDGDRRPLRVPLMYPQVEGGADEHGTYVRCGFELPRGSFATEAMAEVMKPEQAARS